MKRYEKVKNQEQKSKIKSKNQEQKAKIKKNKKQEQEQFIQVVKNNCYTQEHTQTEN